MGDGGREGGLKKLAGAYVMHVKSPGSVVFEGDEEERIERAQLALLLHKLPSEIDAMPLRDVEDVLAIYNANQEIQGWSGSRRRR